MRNFLLSASLVPALFACGGDPVNQSSTASNSSSAVTQNPTYRMERVYGINVGGAAVTADSGYVYEADRLFSGGTPSSTVDPITKTSEDALFQSERYGTFDYQLPVDAGQYQVTLKFVEMYHTSNGARAMNVSTEGVALANNIDIHAIAGHDTAYELTSPLLSVSDGSLSIEITTLVDNGTLSAIEVFKQVEVAAGGNPGSVTTGANLYAAQCSSCHGANGLGVATFPALVLPNCTSCSSHTTLAAKIDSSMPLGGTRCSGSCATDVAAYILATFKSPSTQTGCTVQEAPIRRLTRFEFSNTVRDLLGDDTRPGNLLPSEEIGNGFGNDANSMSVSTLLAEKYSEVAEAIAQRTVSNNNQWQALHSCVATVNSSTQTQCANQIIDRLLNRAFRRPPTSAEQTNYRDLRTSVGASSDFKQSIAAVIEAVLQSPEFLYRPEKGIVSTDNRLKPTAYEMATRLSYFFWGTMPDDALLTAAANGTLNTKDGVMSQATRLLNDSRARDVVRFFFDNYLPISGLSGLERDKQEFPTFSAQIGSLMREETQQFLQYLIFDGPGDWASALTAPYSFMNQTLAEFYGIPGVYGSDFRMVNLNTDQRLGLLTHASIMAGTTHSQKTNPVTRGGYVMKKLLCVDIPLPTGDIAEEIKPPEPSSGLTARERYTKHSSDPVCRNCHKLMDPIGLVFENYDPIGLYRTHENNVLIDSTGELPGPNIPVDNAIQLVTAISEDERTHQCFAYNWANYAYGKTIGANEACIKEKIEQVFEDSNYDIKSLLLNLTQTDAFLNLPADHRQ